MVGAHPHGAVFVERVVMTKKLLVVVGTRPEAIKLAPLVHAINASDWATCCLVLTGQHKDLVVPIFAHFGLQADHDLAAMTPDQSLAEVTARILERLDKVLQIERPDAVVAQGDTVSVLAAGLAAFYRRIPFAHVEAGLRTGCMDNPFPEEMNRVLTGRLSTWHFAPTAQARQNLLREGVPTGNIWVTGNTVIDALKMTMAMPATPEQRIDTPKPFVLVTAHRRENFGEPMANIFTAIGNLAQRHAGLDFVISVHPNPTVQAAASKLAGIANVRLLPPCPYPMFCWLMSQSRFVLSDSGGVQEEAPAIGKPVLVLRHETERPEAVELGANALVGTGVESIMSHCESLLFDKARYDRMANAGSPYGDGRAAGRIVEAMATLLGVVRAREAVTAP